MEYDFRRIEKDWQKKWKGSNTYKVENDFSKPKCYVLDMFPYPSGAGLHVGHPLGYIASDIYSRYKRLKGFNVLHPMGFDSFGLPAEQYALDTGQHPAVTTKKNIETFKAQLDNIGFCYDWEREVQTSDPGYYKWTQWIFLQLFNSFYNRQTNRAEKIESLIKSFEKEGNAIHHSPLTTHPFSAAEWKKYNEKTKQDILMQYRLAYCGYGEVNWCEALGTVLANDEVVNGVSERGSYPVVKKKLRQWYLRITEYADRLLEGLDKVDFSEAMKEMQSNWIGKSSGTEIDFEVRLTPNELRSFPSPAPLAGSGTPGGEGGTSSRFFQTVDKSYWGILKKYGRENRKNPTEAEKILWQRMRNNQLGVKVRRQHAIHGYIADFALLEVKLVVEADGEYHSKEDQRIYDEARTKFLKQYGIDVLQFTNEEVIQSTGNVIKRITDEIKSRKEKQNHNTETAVPLLREEKGSGDEATLRVYTTRPDTIFGVDFMVIAPENELTEKIKSKEQTAAVDEYIAYVKSRSERERMAEKKISGVFTGAYAINPFNGREIPIWIAEYVLAGYGTGAIMAVPCGDQRDFLFAKHFKIPITNIIGSHYNGEEANPTKDAILENSDFINSMVMKDAIEVVIKKIEEMRIGVRKLNYKMRDAAFSRQRYWGEPFPVVWKDNVAYALDESELPVELPHMDELKPGPNAEGPLSNLTDWKNYKGGTREINTMPGYAGSSWYFLRYMDPHNEKIFCNRKISDYWNQVDLYIGGTEHAVGHLLYSRMWTKVLYDLNLIGYDEPYKRLVNQGMITSTGYYVKYLNFKTSDGVTIRWLGNDEDVRKRVRPLTDTHGAVFIDDDYSKDSFFFRLPYAGEFLDEKNRMTRKAYFEYEKKYPGLKTNQNAFIWVDSDSGSEFDYFTVVSVSEKMSKSKYNTYSPDEIVDKYGSDTFRMYEMFLGPVEMSKPWDTKGIEGVHRFLKKFWRLFANETKGLIVTDEEPTAEELKVLHTAIKKIENDTERFSFNTAVSAFMIATNELTDLKCHKRKILEPLLILLAPYAPHIAEELYAELRKASPLHLWRGVGREASILDATFPKWDEKYLKETSKTYPIAINGKTRTELTLALDATQQQVEEIVLKDAVVQKWLEGKAPKKIIYVKNKMINVVA